MSVLKRIHLKPASKIDCCLFDSLPRTRLADGIHSFLRTVLFLCAILFSLSLSAQSWGTPKKDRCIGSGRATYSSRLANDGGKGWENAAKTTSIVINGVNQGTPDRTSNQGLGGMWGEWDIDDKSCLPIWGAPKKDRCIGNGMATYSARLASDAGLGWDIAAKSTTIVINGVNQGRPKRTSNQGVGGMWGEWDIKDDSCLPKWGTPKKDNCISPSIVQYSARLSTDGGMGWEAAAKSTSIVINGVNQGPPKRTSNQGVGGMWGEWDIKDDSCLPRWGTPKKDNCISPGIVQYSARLSTDGGMSWEAAAKSTSIVINGVNQGPPKRISNQGAGGMWGEWDLKDNTCVPKWNTPKNDGCKGMGIVQYSARLASDAGMGWEAAAKSTSIVINGVNQGPPKRISNQGAVGGMWGEWDVKDDACTPKWLAAKKDNCKGIGIVQYSARLSTDAGMGWEAAAKSTSIVINGVNQGPPKRTSNQGVSGMWGEWDIKDNTCVPKWQAAKKDNCKGIGIVQYSARLATDAGMGWEAAAKITPIIINGVDQGTPDRTSDQGIGGMWGEWDVKDETCIVTWGKPKKDGCVADGFVQYSARLATDAGVGWMKAAKMTPITINGVNQGTPDRTSDQGIGGMWGEWNVEDYTCRTEWDFFDAISSIPADQQPPVQISNMDNIQGWDWNETWASYVALERDAIGGWKSMLHVRKFDGTSFGENVFPTQELSATDNIRGWSWDGKQASYVIVENNDKGGVNSILIVRPFDGQKLGPETSRMVLANGDRIVAWSWFGQEAKYIARQDANFLLYETGFDGTGFGKVSERLIGTTTKGIIKGLDFDGENLSLLVLKNGVSNVFLQRLSPRNTGLNPNKDEDLEFVKKITNVPNKTPQLGAFVLDMPPIGSQGREGSCLAWALGYAIMSYEKHQSTGLPYTTNGELLNGVTSPEYLFNRINADNTDCGNGSWFVNNVEIDTVTGAVTFHRGGLNVLKAEGTVDWTYAPYSDKNGCGNIDNSKEPVNPLAAKNKISNYAEILNHSPVNLKNLLNDGFPIAISVNVTSDFKQANESFIWKSGKGGKGTGHAMVLIGYDDAKNAFKVQNSWGTGWGDDGYGWIDYDVIDTLLNDAYILYTDKPVGYQIEEPSYVTVYSEAGYVAKIELNYTVNGIVKVVKQDLSLFFTFRHKIPEGATDVQLKVDGYGVTDPLGFVKNFSGSKINACYKIWGTIFDTRIGEIDCSY